MIGNDPELITDTFTTNNQAVFGVTKFKTGRVLQSGNVSILSSKLSLKQINPNIVKINKIKLLIKYKTAI